MAKSTAPQPVVPIPTALSAGDALALTLRGEHACRLVRPILAALYPDDDHETIAQRLLSVALRTAAGRPERLRLRDRRAEVNPDWFQSNEMIGYVAYVDRFGGDLNGVAERLDYLEDVGATYVHLMAVMKPRAGDNDGGYAIANYRDVDPRLGNLDALVTLIDAMHARNMAVCLDVVLNHTADTHEWARAAESGDEAKRAYYLTYEDRTLPDLWERSLPEVFPDLAPGNFTWNAAMKRWVWTTFHSFQWDLNYANPDVLVEMLDVTCFLANLGIDVLRFDAIAFMWKRLETNCQNQPEAHLLAQVLREMLAVAAPATIVQAEAIVGPDDLVPYLGNHGARQRRECELAYHNQLMVMGWSALAEQNVRLMSQALARMHSIPSWATWCTYVRCHDDIGWAVTDEDAGRVGLTGSVHRAFLAKFFRGALPFSYATGVAFSANDATGDERTSGTTAALVGIDAARAENNVYVLDHGVRRLLLLYGLAFSFGGIPLIYMGDELALPNNAMYTDDPIQAGDSRWIHRPPMDWIAADRRHDAATVEGRVFAGIQRLVQARRSTPALRGGGTSNPFGTGSDRVLGIRREHPLHGPVVVLASFTTEPTMIAPIGSPPAGDRWFDALTGERIPGDEPLTLGGYGMRWLVVAPEHSVVPAPGPRKA